jgi:cytochrome c553
LIVVRQAWFLIVWPIIVGVVAVVVALIVANGQTTSKMSKVDTNIPLWGIQPGLGTVMIEYATRFGNVWQAEQAGNWDMVSYQLNEMTEIQEVGETTRPARADALKKFEDENLKPLMNAAKAKDKAQFEAAYDKAITGCNQCHGDQKDAQGNNFRWVVIQRPTSAAPFSNVRWAAQ